MKHIILFLFITISLLKASSITVAVAANVTYVIEPLIKVFNQKYPQVDVNLIIGSSGKLTAQMIHGAPYDIFMSANMQYADKLYSLGLTYAKPQPYALGALALLSTHENHLLGTVSDILTSDSLDKIAIANPKTAPYGIATVEVFKALHIYEKIKDKLVYGESIAQTVMYTKNVADVGIIAMSALYSKALNVYQKNEDWFPLDSKLYTPIYQGIVILKNTKSLVNAQYFYDFILSKQAQRIFLAHGYNIP